MMTTAGPTRPDTPRETRFQEDDPRRVARELWRRNAVLAVVAAVHVALLVGFLGGLVVATRTIGGEPAWLKPAKFAASIALVTATLGWLSEHLPVDDETLRRISIGIAVTAVIEIVLIGGQAGRGVESHFDFSTPLNGAVYMTMGVAIIGFTLLVGWLLVRSVQGQFSITSAFEWGIVLGLAVFIIGSVQGGTMIALERSVVVTGTTIPVFGWSIAGDLRVAHFVGLHALQALPAAGYLAAVAGERTRLERPTRIVVAFATVYGAVLLLAFLYAIFPLLPLPINSSPLDEFLLIPLST
jgi:hypothetical protein